MVTICPGCKNKLKHIRKSGKQLPYCLQCYRKVHRQSYLRHRDHRLTVYNIWKNNHREEIKRNWRNWYKMATPEQRKRQRKWIDEHPEQFKATTRARRYKVEFGTTIPQYEVMLKMQNSSCAICDRLNSGRKSDKYFIVDHDHQTNQVRGLLCHHCNIALGHMNDDVDVLEKMISYLKKHKNKLMRAA